MVDVSEFIGVSTRSCQEVYRLQGLEWADLDNAAKILEDSKGVILGEITLSILEEAQAEKKKMAFNRAEGLAKQTLAYKEYLERMHCARHKANRAKVEMKHAEMMVHRWQSENATKRLEMSKLSYGT